MKGKTKFVKKYEWVGDVKSYKEPEENEHSIKYNEPNREYDSKYKPTKEELESFLIHPKDNKERITNYEESIKNEAEKAGMTVEEYKALKQRELEEYMGR